MDLAGTEVDVLIQSTTVTEPHGHSAGALPAACLVQPDRCVMMHGDVEHRAQPLPPSDTGCGPEKGSAGALASGRGSDQEPGYHPERSGDHRVLSLAKAITADELRR